MFKRTYLMEPNVLTPLAGLVGERWECYGTTALASSNFVAAPVMLVSDQRVIAMGIEWFEERIGDDWQSLSKLIAGDASE